MGMRWVLMDAGVLTEIVTAGWKADPGLECVYGLPPDAKLKTVKYSGSGQVEMLYEADAWETDLKEPFVVAHGQTDVVGELQKKIDWQGELLEHLVRLGRKWKERAEIFKGVKSSITVIDEASSLVDLRPGWMDWSECMADPALREKIWDYLDDLENAFNQVKENKPLQGGGEN